MFDSTKRLQINAFTTLKSVAAPKTKLVAYRAQATIFARQRVNVLEGLFGPRLASYSDIFDHERTYYMAKQRLTLPLNHVRRIAKFFCAAYSGGTFIACCIPLPLALQDKLFESSWLMPAAIVTICLLSPIVILSTWRLISGFQAEMLGLGDPLRYADTRKRVYIMFFGSAVYYFGSVLRPYYGPLFLGNSGGNAGAEALLPAMMLLGVVGAFGISVCFWALLCVQWINSMNKSATSSFSGSFPVETVLHELLSSIILLQSAKNRKLSLRMQRRLQKHLELVARTVELGMRRQLLTGDRFSSIQIASKFSGIAGGFRDLKLWVATPKSDTYIHLSHLLTEAINHVVAGDWDHLPISSRPLPKPPLLIEVLTVLCMIALAGGLSAVLALVVGRILSLPNSATISAFVGALPLIASYLFSLAMPEISARRIATK